MQELVEKIRSEIQSRGPIPFTHFMWMALYCPVYGYYEKEADIIGGQGDFYTSVSIGPLFGELLAFQFAEWLDCPEIIIPVHSSARTVAHERRPLSRIIEAGAHDGTLARDILSWLERYRPILFERLEYLIIEPSSLRRARQQQTLASFINKVRWLETLGSDREARNTPDLPQPATRNPLPSSPSPPRLFAGVIFSNELLDAMPVHRLGWHAKDHSWFEWGVTWNHDQFSWIRLPQLSPGILPFLPAIPEQLASVIPDGFTIEVPVAARRWWQQAAACLGKGKLLAIDYGFEADELLRPERTQGTLRSYRHHHLAADVLDEPGEQDITAHVNFSMLKETGESCGLATEGLQTQAQFLTGIFAKLSMSKNDFGSWTEQQARQFQTLTHPEHLGRAFRVLVQNRAA